ncbi:hypothetical protein SDC9_59598 [bioreactor metagenome]|uniref:Metallo-beta-lactamase domain-containing protein n=1 Tax=bioreactor metagenome TaxID=1076179 RepID=A0A644XAL1_9ZZZZ
MKKASSSIKISDHFDGKKFFNPTLEKQFSPRLKDIYKVLKHGRVKWPDWVENTATPGLIETLSPGEISISFVNHATFLIHTSGLNILTDPVWSKRASPFSFIGPKRVRKPGISIEKLPSIDVILLSHNHYDHLDVKTLMNLGKRFSPLVLVPLGDRHLVESTGLKNVHEMDWWDEFQANADTKITFAPAQHSSARGPFDRDKSLWGSYFIETGKRSIYFGGDGGYSTHFTEIKKRLGPPEFAILGIGAYIPRSFMKPIHMSPAEAVAAHKDLGAKQTIGMHYGTFHLAAEGFDQPQKDLAEAAAKENIPQDSIGTLLEGETRIFRTTSVLMQELISNRL